MATGVAIERRLGPVITATIAVGGTTSEIVNVSEAAIGMVYLPATFDGTTITFLCSPTYGGTYVALEDASSNAVSITTAASQCFTIPEAVFGAGFIKLVAGSTQTTTDTDILITLKG